MRAENILEINAALNRLSEEGHADWEADARVVIEAFHSLPAQKRVVIETLRITQNRSEVVEGITTEGTIGSVSSPIQEVKAKIKGREEVRIGEFKVWKEKDGEIAFRHFWRTDTVADILDSAKAPEYRIQYDPQTLAPRGVRALRVRPGWKLGPIQVMKISADILYRKGDEIM